MLEPLGQKVSRAIANREMSVQLRWGSYVNRLMVAQYGVSRGNTSSIIYPKKRHISRKTHHASHNQLITRIHEKSQKIY